jgi:hypothetical protein
MLKRSPLFLLTDQSTRFAHAFFAYSLTTRSAFAMASDLSVGAPTSDWGAGLPAEVLGIIGSLLKHPEDLPDGARLSPEDEWTETDRKSIARGRLVSKHWASALPIGVTSVYAKGEAPTRSARILDSVTRLFWRAPDLSPRKGARRDGRTGRRGFKYRPFADHSVQKAPPSFPRLRCLVLVPTEGEACVADIVDSLAGQGTLQELRICGRFSGSDAVLRDVSRLTSLENLEVHPEDDTVSDAGFKALVSLTGLVRLSVRGGERVTDSCVGAVCEKLVCLRGLSLYKFRSITDKCLDHLYGLALRGSTGGIYLSSCPSITARGFDAFNERLLDSSSKTGNLWCGFLTNR